MSRALMFAAAGQLKKVPAFNPADYIYAGLMTIGHVTSGGEEYGFINTHETKGTILPDTFDSRLIKRLSWKRKEYYALNNRKLMVSIMGTSRPPLNEVVVAKDGIIILETSTISQEGTYGDGMYTIGFLTGEAEMPISGIVDIYMR